MPKRDFMKLKLSLVEARMEANLLRIQMQQRGCTCKGNEYQAILDQICKLLSYFQCKENLEKGQESQATSPLASTPDRPRLPSTMRLFFKGLNNQKLCLSICHSLVSQLTNFFCTIFCIFCWVIYRVFNPPNIHSVPNPYNISLGHVFCQVLYWLAIF